MKTAFVADSTLGLAAEEALARGIHLVPVQVIVDGIGRRDGLEFSAADVRTAQLAGKKITTSQPNPKDFEVMYASLLERFDRVLSVQMSSKLSGTFATAAMVAEQFSGRVTVLDSWSLNAGLGFVLEAAQKLACEGVPLEQLEAKLAAFRTQVRGFVLPKTLDGLLQSGRISGAQHLIGSLLKVLPVLLLQDGLVKPLERVRGFQTGLERIAAQFRALYPNGARVVLAHSDHSQAVTALAELLRKEGVLLEGVREAGAAVSVHTGPGTVAVFAAPR